MVGTETPASCESRRQQLLPPPTAGRASPRLYTYTERYRGSCARWSVKREFRILTTPYLSEPSHPENSPHILCGK